LNDNSVIYADVFGQAGGSVDIGAEVFLADPTSSVTASSVLGVSGFALPLSGALAPLPQTFVSAATLLPTRCAARYREGKTSSIAVGGRSGLPPEPGGALPSPLALGERLMADPAVMGAPRRQPSTARFALLAGHEQAFPRLAGDCAH